jgi:hypothetical protein
LATLYHLVQQSAARCIANTQYQFAFNDIGLIKPNPVIDGARW